MRLLEEDETIEQLLRLPPESILLRWFNYQLQEAGHVGRVANFSSDIQDAENYSVLLHQVKHTVVLIPLLSSQKHNLKVLVLEIHSIFSTQLGAFLAAVSFFFRCSNHKRKMHQRNCHLRRLSLVEPGTLLIYLNARVALKRLSSGSLFLGKTKLQDSRAVVPLNVMRKTRGERGFFYFFDVPTI